CARRVYYSNYFDYW
nr:immunoglobulin heavy chain junction region [Mus musculus]MBK4187004.1 immunoglobulin heavy chain junction region [Mus musculus]MBK4187005.1 immunoglobulin heavy chain junction region [Mus musculus]MBK4187007.1 immunoglobulin heavy chain junction region [Mus musculus]MBK4187008.1 immunoglobulin heavy chain junction region [Mus musculus]